MDDLTNACFSERNVQPIESSQVRRPIIVSQGFIGLGKAEGGPLSSTVTQDKITTVSEVCHFVLMPSVVVLLSSVATWCQQNYGHGHSLHVVILNIDLMSSVLKSADLLHRILIVGLFQHQQINPNSAQVF